MNAQYQRSRCKTPPTVQRGTRVHASIATEYLMYSTSVFPIIRNPDLKLINLRICGIYSRGKHSSIQGNGLHLSHLDKQLTFLQCWSHKFSVRINSLHKQVSLLPHHEGTTDLQPDLLGNSTCMWCWSHPKGVFDPHLSVATLFLKWLILGMSMDDDSIPTIPTAHQAVWRSTHSTHNG